MVITGIPFFTGRDSSLPTRYFRLGQFTLGNAHGFIHSQPLEYAQQLLYPVRPDWEVLAYDIKDGASGTFYELVDVPDLSTKQPWDRVPQFLRQGGSSSPGGGAALTTMWTYTVPALRRLMLAQASVLVHRVTAATAVVGPQATMLVDGSSILQATLFSNVAGGFSTNELSAGPLYLPAGAVLSGTYVNGDTAGSVRFEIRAAGLLFDA